MKPNCKIQNAANIDELTQEICGLDFANITIIPPLPKEPKIKVFSREKTNDSATGLF